MTNLPTHLPINLPIYHLSLNLPFNLPIHHLPLSRPVNLPSHDNYDIIKRDHKAVAYSKARLREGNMLINIKYPANCEVLDHTGFRLGSEHQEDVRRLTENCVDKHLEVGRVFDHD